MKKVVIKIDKGIRKKGKMTAAEIAPEVEIDRQQNMVDVVNNWISERRENRLLEKTFSDESISAWKINSSFSNFGQHCRTG
jgi:hypothetical protein